MGLIYFYFCFSGYRSAVLVLDKTEAGQSTHIGVVVSLVLSTMVFLLVAIDVVTHGGTAKISALFHKLFPSKVAPGPIEPQPPVELELEDIG